MSDEMSTMMAAIYCIVGASAMFVCLWMRTPRWKGGNQRYRSPGSKHSQFASIWESLRLRMHYQQSRYDTIVRYTSLAIMDADIRSHNSYNTFNQHMPSHLLLSAKTITATMQQEEQWKTAKGQFPTKLYTILTLADNDRCLDPSTPVMITWLPHGRAFNVLDEERFVRYVMPTFTKQTKIRSFHRQLNLWGFRR